MNLITYSQFSPEFYLIEICELEASILY